ncbi:MAG: hypothetical protein WKF84_12890 [Pyrinomonadaceae bacterium]
MPLLVEHFNQKFSVAYNKTPKRFEPPALEAMQSYSWPGNVRELRNTVGARCHHASAAHRRGLGFAAAGRRRRAAGGILLDFLRLSGASESLSARIHQAQVKRGGRKCFCVAAELMGMDRSHLYRRMKALGIIVRSERNGAS